MTPDEHAEVWRSAARMIRAIMSEMEGDVRSIDAVSLLADAVAVAYGDKAARGGSSGGRIYGSQMVRPTKQG